MCRTVLRYRHYNDLYLYKIKINSFCQNNIFVIDHKTEVIDQACVIMATVLKFFERRRFLGGNNLKDL